MSIILSGYILIFHLVSGLYFTGGIFIAMCDFFRTAWSDAFKELAPLWRKLSVWFPFLLLPVVIFGRTLMPLDEMKGHKYLYYSEWFIIIRALLLSVSLIMAARLLRKIPALSIVIYFVAGTFLAIDWGMGFEKHWSSNIYGLLWLINFAYGFFAIVTYFSFGKADTKTRKDFAHLLITLAVMWGYLQYSQFIIIWMGNNPHEVSFYVTRHFPFGLMVLMLFLKLIPVLGVAFSPRLKTNEKVMKILCVLILLGTIVEVFWLIGPPLGIGDKR